LQQASVVPAVSIERKPDHDEQEKGKAANADIKEANNSLFDAA
jgi:hypothetical protein